MHPEIMENFQEKLRLVESDLVRTLNDDIAAMLAKHAAEGRLGSGDTIKRTMDFISEGNAKLFQTALNHIHTMDITYY